MGLGRVFVAAGFGLMGGDAMASCYAFVGPGGEPVTNADSSVIVAYDGDQTFVTMAADAHSEGASFGYVLPVPAGFSVEDAVLVEPAAYEGLMGFLAPQLVVTSCATAGATNGIVASGCTGPTGFAAGGLPDLSALEAEDSIVAEHRTLGAYDLTVLDPDGGRQLDRWLDDNGFELADASKPVVDELVEQGVWFLAVEVDAGAGDGWVEPLRLRYDGHMNSIPLALGATSSEGIQDLVVLVIDDKDSAARISNYAEVEIETGCMIDGDLDETYDRLVETALLDGVEGRAAWAVEGVLRPEDNWVGDGEHDLYWLTEVGSTAGEDAVLTRLHLRYTPDQIDEDLVLLRDEERDLSRSTYVAYDQELESLYPICEEGFAKNPGSCPAGSGSADGGAAATGCVSVPVGAPWVGVGVIGALARRRRR